MNVISGLHGCVFNPESAQPLGHADFAVLQNMIVCGCMLSFGQKNFFVGRVCREVGLLWVGSIVGGFVWAGFVDVPL